MNIVIRKILHHIVGHCDCCGGYRSLMYDDPELGVFCFGCKDHLMVADIELNFGGYNLCRPRSVGAPSESSLHSDLTLTSLPPREMCNQ